MSAALTVPSPELVRSIAHFVKESGYTEAQLKQYGLTKVPWRGSPMRPLLQYKTPENSPLSLLIRVFFFGETISSQEAHSIVPLRVIEDMLACGMLSTDRDTLTPGCMLTHWGNLLLACDSVQALRTATLPNLVLGVNTPTIVTANCLLSLSNANVLDLGTGCGTLALAASPSACRVTATDVNPRALAFTQFNAVLNGIGNIATYAGDRFEPVQDLSFDLIVCNPPFFLTPEPRLLYTDNLAELDSFVEGLARTGPGFLKEGGFFQMLGEWVEFRQQPWQSRLRTWFEHAGCDVLILKAYEISPVDYTLKRAAESAALHGEASEATLQRHVDYFQQKRVEKILGGLVILRRRNGDNWFLSEEMDEVPTEPIGELLLERFATQDKLASGDELDLLTTKPRLSKGVHLVQESTQHGQSWKPKRIYLERRAGLARRLAFDSGIAEFLARFDGSQTLDHLIGTLAKQNKWPRKEAVDNSMRLVRKLASLGLIAF
jgi:methylase of polypeptide subunit release factors